MFIPSNHISSIRKTVSAAAIALPEMCMHATCPSLAGAQYSSLPCKLTMQLQKDALRHTQCIVCDAALQPHALCRCQPVHYMAAAGHSPPGTGGRLKAFKAARINLLPLLHVVATMPWPPAPSTGKSLKSSMLPHYWVATRSRLPAQGGVRGTLCCGITWWPAGPAPRPR